MLTSDFLSQMETDDLQAKHTPSFGNSWSEYSHRTKSRSHFTNRKLTIAEAQEIIYDFLISLIQQSLSSLALREFKSLFFEPAATGNPEVNKAFERIVSAQKAEDFQYLLKRCCYILLNNWVSQRNYEMSQALIQLLSESQFSFTNTEERWQPLKTWLFDFIQSEDCKEIKLFVSRYNEDEEADNWTERYTSFLLAPQYANEKNPIEQRQAAQVLSKQLKEQFKIELAMYTARAQAEPYTADKSFQNPTIFGDDVLLFIKKIVARKGSQNYAHLAKIFLDQIRQISYSEFKKSLLAYLLYSEGNTSLVKTLRVMLYRQMDGLYESYDQEKVSNSLIFLTCNKLIRLLTIERNGQPSALLNLLITQSNPLTLAVMLLKLVLISPRSRTHLEVCLASLILHYSKRSPQKCQGFIKFLEICKIVLTIYAENVQYNLVKMSESKGEKGELANLSGYRVFSLMNSEKDFAKPQPEATEPEEELE